jgi:hypothetical protein
MIPYQNFWLLSFAIWPGVVLVSALLNMAIWAEFGWSELIVDYVIGFTLGVCFWWFVRSEQRSFAPSFFLVFTHGLFGLLRIVNVIPDTKRLFWWSAGATIGCTVLTAALDHAAVGIGTTMSGGGAALGVLIFLLKLPFALFSTAIGLLIFIVGLIHAAAASNAGAGFLGGVTYEEWNTTKPNWATTVGATVHCWQGTFSDVMKHELYHSRQYIYMRDLLIPSWAVCWTFSGQGDKNPIEVVAYKIQR